MWWTQQPRLKFPSFSAESNSLQSATREAKTNPTISYPIFPPDQSGKESGGSTSPYPNWHPPSASHPSGHGQPSTETHGVGMTTMPNTTLPHLVNQPGQPSTETHGVGMTTMPNTPLGSAAIPATVTHTQPSYVTPGTDPLSSRDAAGQPTLERRWTPHCLSLSFCEATCGISYYIMAEENEKKGYLLPIWAWKITCWRFDQMLQLSSGRNISKLFSELKLVTDNLSLYLCSSQLRSHWKWTMLWL